MRLIALALSGPGFAPYGSVSTAPQSDYPVRIGPVANLRRGAQTHLDWVLAQPRALPLSAQVMERHRQSSQSFIPRDGDARWLVLVAPPGRNDRPDMEQARAFVAGGDQALTYAPDVWHHPLCALGRPVRFALLTHRDGGPEDDEFVTLSEPLEIVTQA